MSEAISLLTPIGRMVAGSMYKPNDKAFDGSPLVVKSGPNAGQPRVEYYFGLAIPKGSEQHWSQTEWGQLIYNAGVQGFPGGQAQQPTFAWKIVDGDSQQPNRRGTIPANVEGYAGHWVLNFSSGYQPKLFNADGTQQLIEIDAVKPGYYIQVYGTVRGNDNSANPGVFLNHSMVALAGFGPEIMTGPDAGAVGFGGALPPGASPTPVGGGFNPAPTQQQQQFGQPGQPGSYQQPQGQPMQQQQPQGQPMQQQQPQGQPMQQQQPQGQPMQPYNGFNNPQQ